MPRCTRLTPEEGKGTYCKVNRESCHSFRVKVEKVRESSRFGEFGCVEMIQNDIRSFIDKMAS